MSGAVYHRCVTGGPGLAGEGEHPRMHCFLASYQNLMLVLLELREEEEGMAEVKVFICRVLRRLAARGHLAVSHQETH